MSAPESLAQLLETLRTTSDPRVRNDAALRLSDAGEPEAFSVLVQLLSDERTKKSRGTLIYALGAYDCASIMPLLVELAIDGNFEVSRQAAATLSGIETEIDARTWDECAEKIRMSIPTAPEENRELLRSLLSLFDNESTGPA